MPRFCWRERTERVNWRLLRNLQLADVVKRGDATLLEPYALHLTFARLPVVVAALAPSTASRRDVLEDEIPHDHARNAWFLVRVFQLAMEYLLFLRARDGTVVDSLREELLGSERECELLVERAKKWKDRSRSGERQVEKLHQVLQSIANLLQIEGATASAVSTIETLLRDLVPSGRSNAKPPAPSVSHVEEARVCALCGKMFSSQAFLDKHIVRRHPGAEMKSVYADTNKHARSTKVARAETESNNQVEVQMDRANDMKGMLRVVEQTLHDHEAALRSVAQQEADKLHNLYQQLHVETQLAEDMRAKRLAVETEIEKGRQELEAIEQEIEDLAVEVRGMKEQLQFLGMKKTIQTQNSGLSSTLPVPHDKTLQLELKRLEETVAMMKEALSAAREELQRIHEIHGALLKEKGVLESQLHETRNHALRLEANLRQAEDHIPTMRADVGIQATVAIASSMVQTDDSQQTPTSPIVAEPAARMPVAAGEAAVQTETQARSECTDTMMQTDPEEIIPPPIVQIVRTQSATTTSIGVGVEDDLATEAEELDSVFKVKCASLLDLVQRRADMSAHAASTARTDEQDDAKVFSSLSRRPYLHSRFHHDERTVTERISTHVAKLEQTSLRYGVSPKSSVLANEHVEVVQRALHAHLEVLPSEVLQSMVDIESSVNALIRTHWMPQEKSRQQALERLTADLEAKSQANQGLVRQAMVAFASGVHLDSTINPTKQSTAGVFIGAEPVTDMVPRKECSDDRGKLQTIEEDQATLLENDVVARVERQSSFLSAQSTNMQTDNASTSASAPRSAILLPVESTADSSEPAAFEQSEMPLQQGEPSPVSVQEVRRHAIAVRAVKVISVSPKSSPPKSPPCTQPTDSTSDMPAVLARDQLEDEGRQLTRGLDPKETHGSSTGAESVTATSAGPPTTEPMQPPGTSVMSSRVPSLFSAKHPDSQLGIVIPSRYEPTAISVASLQDDAGLEDSSSDFSHDAGLEASGSDFSHTPAGHALRWSSSVGGRSGGGGGVSERSLSAVESSEISFNASLPSLGSEGVGVSRSFPHSSTEQLPTIMPNASEDQDDAVVDTTAIQDIPSIQEEASESDEESTVQTLIPDERVIPASVQQHSPQLAPPPSEVMTFQDDEDDSDIEEVLLA